MRSVKAVRAEARSFGASSFELLHGTYEGDEGRWAMSSIHLMLISPRQVARDARIQLSSRRLMLQMLEMAVRMVLSIQ